MNMTATATATAPAPAPHESVFTPPVAAPPTAARGLHEDVEPGVTGTPEAIIDGEAVGGLEGKEKDDDDNADDFMTTTPAWERQLHTVSYLIFFSIFGTLARLGLQALTTYPGAPVIFTSVWYNFAGSFVMGFLAEDRMLFRWEWGTPTYELQIRKANKARQQNGTDSGGGGGEASTAASASDLANAKKAHAAVKKTIPLYIGLATGFCGSFTSFSSFIRDAFLAVFNDLQTTTAPPPRNGGYSFLAFLAVILATLTLSLSGLRLGTHAASALQPFLPSLLTPRLLRTRLLDRTFVILGWGCWLGAVLLSALPPDGHSDWRGAATISLTLAPLGCLLRFYLSLYLNGRKPHFPLGTFAVNLFGTAVLGMAWDLAHAPATVGGGVVGCQVLQGVEDGFCGALTTVSTWVAELSALPRREAYVYGSVSFVAGFSILIAIMGGLGWSSQGFGELLCTH